MSREIKSPEATILSAKSFDGKHEIVFNEASHRYKLNGKATIGVTTFLKAGYPTSMGLISWFKTQTAEALFSALTVPGEGGFYPREAFFPINKMRKDDLFKEAKAADRAVSQEAADIGTIAHSFCELWSLGKKDEAAALQNQLKSVEKWPVIESCINKFLDWDAHNKGELILAEALIASPKYGFCGKIDRLDKVNGRIRLRDYKTSKSFYPDQFIQMGAYAIALAEWNSLIVEEFEIIRLGKEDGEFETLLITDPKEIQMFKDQAIRCRETFEFTKLDKDPRFDWKKPKGN